MILARLNAPTHEKERYTLIIVIRSAVRGAPFALLASDGIGNRPVGFRDDNQIAAAPGEIAVRKSGSNGISGSGAIFDFFAAIDSRYSRNSLDGVDHCLHGACIPF